MGAITLEKSNNLYWLGRYIERVFTGIINYQHLFDKMIDGDLEIYKEYCQRLEIEDNYFNDAHFITSYLFDKNNADSIVTNLSRAYDNAIILRDEISSESLSYIQLSINIFERMEFSDAPVLELQKVQDNIYAFWGSIEETVEEGSRNITKCGKYAERVDLYYRLQCSKDILEKSICRLVDQVDKIKKLYHLDDLNEFKFDKAMSKDHLDYIQQLNNLNILFMVQND